MQHYAKSRLLSLDNRFRKSPVWAFWMLERNIKNTLYFQNKNLQKQAACPAQAAAKSAPTAAIAPLLQPLRGQKRSVAVAGFEKRSEPYAELFGRIEPRTIPESGAWWRSRQAELMAISDEHENGLMTGMVTSTQNDNSPELLAHARRGPCAVPEDAEMFEYLLTRHGPREKRADVQADATAATLSFQSRTLALRRHFMSRNRRTPLGVVTDFWDRTEAQNRQALHAHILTWNKRRKLSHDYKPRPAMPKPSEEGVAVPPAGRAAPDMNPEDDVYYRTETARVLAELVRPLPSTGAEPQHNRDVLLWGFLLRSIQTHLYIHACTPLYCLKNRATCRFFFPWKEQPQQQYDECTDRLALQRRHGPDDQYVVPHNLELAAFSPATVNVLLFDYMRGADQCRSYACKYCGKPEPWYFLETATPGGEANPVKRYLQARNVGLCMCHNRLMGHHVVRSTRPTLFLWPQFTVADASRIHRTPEHLANVASYPDNTFYLNGVQKYFFRNEQL